MASWRFRARKRPAITTTPPSFMAIVRWATLLDATGVGPAVLKPQLLIQKGWAGCQFRLNLSMKKAHVKFGTSHWCSIWPLALSLGVVVQFTA